MTPSMAGASPSVGHTPGPATCSAFAKAFINRNSHLAKLGVFPNACFACSSARHSVISPATLFLRASHFCVTVGLAAPAATAPKASVATVNMNSGRFSVIVVLLCPLGILLFGLHFRRVEYIRIYARTIFTEGFLRCCMG